MNSKQYSNNYGFGKKVEGTFDEVIQKITDALKKEGFGILSEIDVAATLKKKLNLEMSAYRILGACNPQLAHSAIEIEPSIGLLLPCNVVVRMDEQNDVYVEILDPIVISSLVNKPEVNNIAIEAKAKLERVINDLT